MKFPIGIQNFETLRGDGYVYVDKTALIYQMVDSGRYYFLGRPRRFGKSLLISTIEAYFRGRKDLFQGLDIEKLEHDWDEYPVLHLDLNTESYIAESSLDDRLRRTLRFWENMYGTDKSETSPALRFEGIVRRAYEKTGKRVVILVDEYDKPMLQAIGDEKLLESHRNTLKAFYSVLKTQDRYIKFALLTGVTKFGKVSVFSDLNNLNDISMDDRYVALCGITEAEIHTCFKEPVEAMAKAAGKTREEILNMLKAWYDGYHFEYDTMGIFNPFSLLNTFDKLKFKDYWFETGTPSFLVQLLKRSAYDLDQLQKEEVSGDILNSIDSLSDNPVPVIYQSGYLTIKGYDEEFRSYKLGFPNLEVEQGFNKYLLPYYTPISGNAANFAISQFVRDVRKGNPDGFLSRLQTLLDDEDYCITGKMEKYFQNAMYLIFKLMGFYVEVERATARGRVDVVLKTADYIYVMELKLDGSADEALRQIDDKGYALPYAKDSRKLYKIGINFSGATRTLEAWKIEEA